MLVKTALVQYQKMLVSFQMKMLVTGQRRSGRKKRQLHDISKKKKMFIRLLDMI